MAKTLALVCGLKTLLYKQLNAINDAGGKKKPSHLIPCLPSGVQTPLKEPGS